ncbi:hypothetical protein LTS18_010933, partial [Coniosporium uncinatum]
HGSNVDICLTSVSTAAFNTTTGEIWSADQPRHLRLEKLKDATLTCGHAGRHDIKVYGYVLADYSFVFRHIINDFNARPVPEDDRIIDCSTFTPNTAHAMVRYEYYGDYDWR